MLDCHTNVKTDAQDQAEVEIIKMSRDGLDSEVGTTLGKCVLDVWEVERLGDGVTQALREVSLRQRGRVGE